MGAEQQKARRALDDLRAEMVAREQALEQPQSVPLVSVNGNHNAVSLGDLAIHARPTVRRSGRARRRR